MRCPDCGAEAAAGQRFCGECGAALRRACPRCGATAQSGAKFCGNCGAALSEPGAPPPARPAPLPEGELRQVTVLFADVCDYTTISGRLGAEETHALLGRYFETVDAIIVDHGGTVDKHIGDCVMAVFGAPIAHSNDPERALRAALRIQDGVAAIALADGTKLAAHVGLASGQVVASGTGSAQRQDYTVIGDSVNLAARLTSLAGRGETLMSEALYEVVGGLVEAESVGAVAVKGFDQPVEVWRLRGLASAQPASRPPLVGRDPERQQFIGLVEACIATGAGATLHLRGEAGIGKSRLVEEFKRLAHAQGFVCHAGQALDFGAGRDAIRALVRSLVGLRSPDEAAARAAAAAALAAGLIDPAQAVYLNDLLDLPQPIELRSVYDAMDNVARGRGQRETVATLARQTAARTPLLLVIEDLHWADPFTLAHLASLATTAAHCAAILVMTSRIEGDPLDGAWRAAAGDCPPVTIDLAPLRREDALALAGAFMDAGDAFAQACIERAAGNPLFLEQLLRSMPKGGGGDVPASVKSLVMARMDRLDPLDRQGLQTASVIGQRFMLPPLQYLLGHADYRCSGLIEQFMVRPEGEEFVFAHALIQEGVYVSLLKARRRDLHRRAADWFAARDLVLRAAHLDRAEDEAAPQAYLAAAEAQAAAYRMDRAVELVERGLALARKLADRFALTLRQGEILHDLGSIPAATAAFEQALTAAADDAERCRALIGLAGCRRLTDEYDRAFAALDEAESAARRLGLVAELARVHHLRGNLHFPRGNLRGCREQHELAIARAREAGSPELEARALGGLGDAGYAEGRLVSAHADFRNCVDLARRNGLGRIEVANHSMLAFTRYFSADLPGTRDEALAAIAAAARVGHQRAETIAHHAAYIARFEMGEIALAREHVDRALLLAKGLGSPRFEAEAYIFQAEMEHAAGRRDEASRLLAEALAISRATGMGFLGPMLLGLVAVVATDPSERANALAEGSELLARGSLCHNHIWFRRYAIDALLAAADCDSAARHAQALADYTAIEPLPWTDFLVARGRALAAHGRDPADAAARDAIARLRDQARRLSLRAAQAALDRALVPPP